MPKCFPPQERQRRRELRERPGAAAGGRAQPGRAGAAPAGSRQGVHGESSAARDCKRHEAAVRCVFLLF